MPVSLDLVGNVLLFALVFGMSATVDIKCMQQQIRNKNAILLGLFCQFFLLPFLGFVFVNLLQLDAALGMTLLVVTSSPGGSYSNWWCSLFNADLALSVTMTAISTILSTFALPVNLLIYAKLSYEEDITQALDWPSVFVALAIVISAIALGLYLSYYTHSYKFNVIANKIGNVAGLCLIIFSATVTNTGEAGTKIWSRDASFFLSCIGPCVLGLLISSFLASILKLEKPERMSVAVECCYQNVGIATSMALTMFEGKDLNNAMGIPFFYGMCEAVIVGTYCVCCWKLGWSKAPADAPIWEVVLRTYEVLAAEKQEVCEIEISVSSGSEDSHDREEGNVFFKYFEMNNQSQRPKSPSGAELPAAFEKYESAAFEKSDIPAIQ